ncbi:MAG TPA: TMEM175 family protein [Rubrobacter sp.]
MSDGVYAIALTLLAVELILPESATSLHGNKLLESLFESWPKVLAFLISFTVIANFWVGHNDRFQHVRLFDGGLMWLALLQLLCVAFIPFPTSVIGGHIEDPVAQHSTSLACF